MLLLILNVKTVGLLRSRRKTWRKKSSRRKKRRIQSSRHFGQRRAKQILSCALKVIMKSSLRSDNLQTEDDYKSICGVRNCFFKQVCILLKSITAGKNCSKEDKIMIFFAKLSHDLPYVFMSKVFHLHRTTISAIFNEVLDDFYKEASKWTW